MEMLNVGEERVAIYEKWAKMSVAQVLDEFGRDDLCSWVLFQIDL